MKEHYFSQLDDYNEPFCEKTIHAWVLLDCLFKFKSFDQFNPPEPPKILDIYPVVTL